MYEYTLFLLAATVSWHGAVPEHLNPGEDPKCHVYTRAAGTVTDIKSEIRFRYSSRDLCSAHPLKKSTCYSYLVDEDECNGDHTDLVEHFMEEAKRDGKVS